MSFVWQQPKKEQAAGVDWEDSLEKGTATNAVFWPGEFHGLYSPWGHKEPDTRKRKGTGKAESVGQSVIPAFVPVGLLTGQLLTVRREEGRDRTRAEGGMS